MENLPFRQHAGSTTATLKAMLQPYANAMAPATTLEQLVQWVRQVFTNEELRDYIESTLYDRDDTDRDPKRLQQAVLRAMLDNIYNYKPEYLTPWDVIRTGLFPTIDNITVTITIGPSNYDHIISQDLAEGLYMIIRHYPHIQMSIYGEIVNEDVFTKGFFTSKTMMSSDFYYEANLIINNINHHVFFSSGDYIQGINTGALWVGLDPKLIIVRLIKFDNYTQQQIPLTF